MADISRALEEQWAAADDQAWAGSPYAWLRTIASGSRGKAGENMAEAWLREQGFTVDKRAGKGHDRVVCGTPVEIKTSTLWAGGIFMFAQLRNQNYDHALLLAISPHRCQGWLVPKQALLEHSIPQHGGADGVDTRWLRITADDIPAWLAPYGGTLDELAERCRTVWPGNLSAPTH